MGGFLLVFWLVCLPFFFLFNSNTFQLLTNYQLLSTSLFQGEPGWAEEPQEWLVSSHPLLGSQERTQEPRTSASSGHQTQDHMGTQDLRLLGASDPGPYGNPGPSPPRGIRPRTSAPCWDRTECGEQACVSDQEGKSTAGLVPSPWLFPLDYVPASVSQKWLAKAPGVSWPALHSQQAASSSRRWPPAHTASLWSGPPGRCKAGRDTGGAETHRRDVAAPHWPSGPSGLRCPVSCWEAMSRVRSGREGKGPGGALRTGGSVPPSPGALSARPARLRRGSAGRRLREAPGAARGPRWAPGLALEAFF